MSEKPDSETGFLEQLGQRVRTMRALRGMSRKVLAKVSGISERYIAQLESGKGNVSIVLLRRVSNAMGAQLEDLIPGNEAAPDWAVVRDLLRKATPSQVAQAKTVLAGQDIAAQRRTFAGIALIGLRGAGKSTLGKMLAKKIGWRGSRGNLPTTASTWSTRGKSSPSATTNPRHGRPPARSPTKIIRR
jgi:XRE family aerobic/anaerobic benzoate catabolism transcriptional regulator